MMGNVVDKVSIEKVLLAIGVKKVMTIDPLNTNKAVDTVKEITQIDGVKAIIFKSPCIAVSKPAPQFSIDESSCIDCKKCIRELGCPAIVLSQGRPYIEPSLCFGCGLCANICPTEAIKGGISHEQ